MARSCNRLRKDTIMSIRLGCLQNKHEHQATNYRSIQLPMYEVIIFVENKLDICYCIFDKYNNVNIAADCLGTGLLAKAN